MSHIGRPRCKHEDPIPLSAQKTMIMRRCRKRALEGGLCRLHTPRSGGNSRKRDRLTSTKQSP